MATDKKAIKEYLKTATFKGSPLIFRERYSSSAYVVKFKDLKPFKDLGFTDGNAEIGIAIYYGEYAEEDVNGSTEEKVICLKASDTIDFICDFYDMEGNYSNTYKIGHTITVGDGLEMTDMLVKAEQILFGYELQDIYDSARRTPMLTY